MFLSHFMELPPPTGTRIYSATASDTFIRRGALTKLATSRRMSLADANMVNRPHRYYAFLDRHCFVVFAAPSGLANHQ